ncbi:MAG TPA: hypothetical protein VF933_16950 [Streptosporangiaceae bacterium]
MSGHQATRPCPATGKTPLDKRPHRLLRTGLRHAGENAARQAIQDRQCAVDLSSLHLLGLLADDDRLLIRAALPDITTARSAVSDAVLTRDKLRALGVATYTAALRHDDSIEKTTLTPAQHAALRDQAAALEASASSTEIRTPAAAQDAPADTIAIAREGALPLWCDDMALRQQARLRGVPTFSLLDLITELTRQGTPLSPRSALRRLAGHYVVDLPRDADDIIELAGGDWRPGPAHTALARPAWWQAQGTGWPGTWLPVAAEARNHSATGLPRHHQGRAHRCSEFRHQQLPDYAAPGPARHLPRRLPRGWHHRPAWAARPPRGLRPLSLPRS